MKSTASEPGLRESIIQILNPRQYWFPDFTRRIQDSRYWTPDFVNRTPIVSGIPDSLSCIPDSKAKDSSYGHKQKSPGTLSIQQKFQFEILETSRAQWNGTFRLHRPDTSHRAFWYCGLAADSKLLSTREE